MSALTPHQVDAILESIAQGESPSKIARAQGLSEQTIKQFTKLLSSLKDVEINRHASVDNLRAALQSSGQLPRVAKRFNWLLPVAAAACLAVVLALVLMPAQPDSTTGYTAGQLSTNGTSQNAVNATLAGSKIERALIRNESNDFSLTATTPATNDLGESYGEDNL